MGRFKVKEVSAQALTVSYLSALSIVAGLSIACHWIMARELRITETTASVINLAGRQRMLSQRIAGMAAEYRLGVPGARQELLDSAAAFSAEHQHLISLAQTGQVGDLETADFQRMYFSGSTSLDSICRNYVSTARRIAATPVGDPSLAALSSDLFAQSRSSLLQGLEAVVSMHQSWAERHLARLRRVQWGALVILLTTLVAEALLIFRPMTRRIVRSTEDLVRLATVDPLTGIANRRKFNQSASTEFDRAKRHGRPLSFLAIDVDRFKSINDTYGHDAGDQVLTALTAVLSRAIRASDLLGRLGGEEFGLLLPDTDLAAAIQVAERLRQDLAAEQISHREITMAVTISIGVAQVTRPMTDHSQTMSAADAALYLAKKRGRNRVAVAESSAGTDLNIARSQLQSTVAEDLALI